MTLPNTTEFDAIVVGSGISGGWAAKELSEKGLSVLVLERGAPLQHGKDYIGEHVPPWQTPFRGKPLRELYQQDYRVQSTSYAFNELTRHFWLNDRENPYDLNEDNPFLWMRGGRVGGKSIMWDDKFIAGVTWISKQIKKMATELIGRFVMLILRPGIAT
ncbi:FAD-dependent oxidoreductase [Oceanicoccus sp. KOV_DT_Chl]|uniref:FAD-dependent oxidoreductase n=1 Tax=Oceanicoccus sp. KOV_DT_Chl TaxID=1904639 RepID=UPI00350F9AD0